MRENTLILMKMSCCAFPLPAVAADSTRLLTSGGPEMAMPAMERMKTSTVKPWERKRWKWMNKDSLYINTLTFQFTLHPIIRGVKTIACLPLSEVCALSLSSPRPWCGVRCCCVDLKYVERWSALARQVSTASQAALCTTYQTGSAPPSAAARGRSIAITQECQPGPVCLPHSPEQQKLAKLAAVGQIRTLTGARPGRVGAGWAAFVECATGWLPVDFPQAVAAGSGVAGGQVWSHGQCIASHRALPALPGTNTVTRSRGQQSLR